MFGRCEVESSYHIGTLIAVDSTSISGYIVLAFQNLNKLENYHLKTFSISPEWRLRYGCASRPVISRLNISANIFVEGDTSIASREILNSSNYSLAMIRSSLEMSEIDCHSMKYFHNIFIMKLVPNDLSPIMHIGTIDFVTSMSSWLKDLSDDVLLSSMYFTPNAIRLNEMTPPLCSVKVIIVKGACWNCEKTSDRHCLNPSICIVKHSDGSFENAFFNFRDAHFYYNENSDSLKIGVLALCSSGVELKSLSINQDGDCELLNTTTIHEEVVSFWLSPSGTNQQALYVSAIKNRIQFLFISNRGEIAINSMSRYLKLGYMERVIDIQWQPSPNLLKKDQELNLNGKASESSINNSITLYEPLLAVLTTVRVMILSTNLDILNTHSYTLPAVKNKTESRKNTSITSIKICQRKCSIKRFLHSLIQMDPIYNSSWQLSLRF
jgi:hypothetical protein